MKKSLLLLFSILCLSASGAYAQQHGIGIHFGAYDFWGPQTDKYFYADQVRYSYNDAENRYDSGTRKKLYWRPLVKLSYWARINRLLDVSAGLSFADIDYPTDRPDSAFINRYYYQTSDTRRQILIELDAKINYNILPRDRWIAAPYLFAGVTGSYHGNYFGADIPLGIGVHINLTSNKDINLNLESGYKIAATSHDQNHLQHTIGFVYWFKPGYREPKAETAADVPPPPPDTDGDGIPDVSDDCPSIAGTAQFSGCPDSDGDGVSDKDDECPLVAGLPQLKGCPDSDGDGINDKDDKCPYVAGTADRQGCPIPDKDGDGFNDDVDRCPEVYSTTNNGCPEIRREVILQVERAAKAIFFETGKATLKKNSFKSLDAVVRVLKADPSLYADIEGHTDNVGEDEMNMTLSQNRAQSVVDYFVSKGIEPGRLTAQGFGETQPVADNGSAAGRAQNRRTVIKLRNYAK